MSDIKVGDLVQVVRSCCARAAKPVVFVVIAFDVDGTDPCDPWKCELCRTVLPAEVFVESENNMHPISWVKRIPPLDELEREQEKKEMTV